MELTIDYGQLRSFCHAKSGLGSYLSTTACRYLTLVSDLIKIRRWDPGS